MNIPIYIDKNLITAIGTQLVGLNIEKSNAKGSGLSLNWLIQSNVTIGETSGVGRDIRELLPEQVLYMIYPELKYNYKSIEECVNALSQTGDKRLLPGESIVVRGVLHFPNIIYDSPFDPFNPPTVEVKTFWVHGEECFVGRLEGDGFRIPLYFPKGSQQQVTFCDNMPVEAIGVIRWSPAYSTGGAKSLNSILRVAALLLR